MEKRQISTLNIKTSLLGFGCMRFPTLANDEINEKESELMLNTAMDAGVNYIDTAYPYHNGKSESFTGKVLKKRARDSFYLATKLPCWEIETKEDVVRIFNKQLANLQTDTIDFYLLHALGKERFDKMLTIGALDVCLELQKQGKIKYLGFSFHDDYNAFEYILNYRNWDFCQIQLNYMDTNEQAGLKGYELATKKNIPVIVMEPIKGGSLANLPENIECIFKEIHPDKSNSSWALRYVGTLDNVKVILSGMSTLEQVQDNLSVFKNFSPIDKREQTAIDKVAKAMALRVKNGCTSCRYCMPCPAGVDIPKNFNAWNQYHIYKNKGQLGWSWKMDMPDNAKAKNCTQCGSCEKVCPQKIKIRSDLQRVQKDLDEAIL